MMKNYAHVLALMACAMSYPGNTNDRNLPTETDEDHKNRLREQDIKRKIKQGLKEYFYPEHQVSFWAKDQKNADRKYNNFLKTNL